MWSIVWDNGTTTHHSTKRLRLEDDAVGRQLSSPLPPRPPNGGSAAAAAAVDGDAREDDPDDEEHDGDRRGGEGESILDDEEIADPADALGDVGEGLPLEPETVDAADPETPAARLHEAMTTLSEREGHVEVVGGVSWTVVNDVTVNSSSVVGDLLPVDPVPEISARFASTESVATIAATTATIAGATRDNMDSSSRAHRVPRWKPSSNYCGAMSTLW